MILVPRIRTLIQFAAVDVPAHMIPPNPDDSDGSLVFCPPATGISHSSHAHPLAGDRAALPSQIHPSYPYGNPRSLKHPANKPRTAYTPGSRALFEDMGFGGAGLNAGLRWNELALDSLLPVDEEKEEAKKAAQARKMASGAASNHPQQPAPAPQQPQDQTIDGEDDDDDDGEDSNEEDEEEDNDGADGSFEEEGD